MANAFSVEDLAGNSEVLIELWSKVKSADLVRNLYSINEGV